MEEIDSSMESHMLDAFYLFTEDEPEYYDNQQLSMTLQTRAFFRINRAKPIF